MKRTRTVLVGPREGGRLARSVLQQELAQGHGRVARAEVVTAGAELVHLGGDGRGRREGREGEKEGGSREDLGEHLV